MIDVEYTVKEIGSGEKAKMETITSRVTSKATAKEEIIKKLRIYNAGQKAMRGNRAFVWEFVKIVKFYEEDEK